MFVAAADEGSFSAAARRVQRTQSAVSEAILNLEAQLGVALFDRSGRYPKLTNQGVILLADARAVITDVDAMKARAKGIAGGLEAELAAVVDVFLPIEMVAEFAREFRMQFPATPLRLYVEALGGAVQPVIDGRVSLGIVGSLPTLPQGLVQERVTEVTFMMVAAASHPLASYRGTIPKAELARHVQLVLTDRSSLSEGREFGVMSPSTWRLADLFAKHAFLVAGLGWGGMPLQTVAKDIAEGRLVELSVEDVPSGGLALPMFAIYRDADPPGPAGRWMIQRLKDRRQAPGV
jgi:DNA-binding transcriptional LysR family regulator